MPPTFIYTCRLNNWTELNQSICHALAYSLVTLDHFVSTKSRSTLKEKPRFYKSWTKNGYQFYGVTATLNWNSIHSVNRISLFLFFRMECLSIVFWTLIVSAMCSNFNFKWFSFEPFTTFHKFDSQTVALTVSHSLSYFLCAFRNNGSSCAINGVVLSLIKRSRKKTGNLSD